MANEPYCTYPGCKEPPEAWEHKSCREHPLAEDPDRQEWCHSAICHPYHPAVVQ